MLQDEIRAVIAELEKSSKVNPDGSYGYHEVRLGFRAVRRILQIISSHLGEQGGDDTELWQLRARVIRLEAERDRLLEEMKFLREIVRPQGPE